MERRIDQGRQNDFKAEKEERLDSTSPTHEANPRCYLVSMERQTHQWTHDNFASKKKSGWTTRLRRIKPILDVKIGCETYT